MAMSEAHKQAVRDGIARKKAVKAAASQFAECGTPAVPESGWNSVTLDDVIEPGLAAEQNREVNPGITVGKHSFTPAVTRFSAFAAWLGSPEGRSASDPRVPQDRVRFSSHLEDVLRRAYFAGYREGSTL